MKRAKHRITQTTPRDRSGTLVFWRQKSLVDDPPRPWNLRSKWPTPFQTLQFLPISAHSASTVRANEKCVISTNRKSSIRFWTSHRWTVYTCTLPLSPQSVAQNAILPVKFNFCRKKSATKFLSVKTSVGKVVAASLRYITVHRRIAGDVHIYLILALKMTHLLRKLRFRQILLNNESRESLRKKFSYH